MSESCIATPYINDDPSELYLEMKKRTDNRELTNYIYARYLTSGVADAMDKVKDKNGNPKYKRNSQGQHKYADIYEFLNVKEILKEQNSEPITDGIELGTATPEGDYIDFKNPEEAFQKAMEYNSKHEGRVAIVAQHGDVYNVIIENINVRNQVKKGEIEAQILAWEHFKEQMLAAGVDFDALVEVSEGSLNPMNLEQFLKTLEMFVNVDLDVLSIRDIKIYLTLNKNLPGVQALLNRGWGDLNTIAEKCYGILNNGEGTATLKTLVSNTLEKAKSTFPFNLKDVKASVKEKYTTETENENNIYFSIDKTIKKLNEEIDIYTKDINRKSKKIRTLEDAVSEAITSLERQIRRLEDKHGFNDTIKEIGTLRDNLTAELQQNQQYYGLLSFLKKAEDHTTQIRQILAAAETGVYNTNLEKIRNVANALSQAENLKNAYYDIISSLTQASKLAVHENVRKEDMLALEEFAKDLKGIYDKLWSTSESNMGQILRLQKGCTLALLEEYLGDEALVGLDGAKIGEFLMKDATIMDMLYSMGKSSNDLIALAGTIIKDAQIKRDSDLDAIRTRIKKATKALYDSGSRSEFMYDSKGRLVAVVTDNDGIERCVDFDAYSIAKSKYYHKLRSQGIKGMNAKEAMEVWEKDNTIELVVDNKTGRTERIPNESYRLKEEDAPIKDWTEAQKKYYYEMMQIKGEMASLLPFHAQKQFFAPQLRKSWLEVLDAGIRGKLTASQVGMLLWDKFKHKFGKISADEADYQVGIAKSDYDNTMMRDIPIFYMNPVEFGDPDLSKNFSSTLQSFASTCLNYHAMNEIQSTIEMIRDFTGSLNLISKDERGKLNIDKVSVGDEKKGGWGQIKNIVLWIFTKKAKETKAYEMLNSYIDYHLYNKKKYGKAWVNKLGDSFLGLNSKLRLAVNVTGAAMNIIAGDLQMIIESGGGRYYNTLDLIQAHAKMFGKGLSSPGIVWDIINGTEGNLDVLIGKFFDVFNDNFETQSHETYYKNPMMRLFGNINAMVMYSGGEGLIRGLNMYAMLYHEKVLIDGVKQPLIKAFTKTDREGGFSDLKLVDNVTTLDGTPITLDGDYLKKFKKTMRGVAEDCFGAMSTEDKGLINQRLLGRMVMSFRQWMVGHYSRRFRGKHWDADKEEYVTGYYTQTALMLWKMIKGYSAYREEFERLSPAMQAQIKSSYRKVFTEFIILACLMALNFSLGDVDDDDDEVERWGMLLVKRALQEVKSSTPTPWLITEGYRILDSPIPSTSTIEGLLYPIWGLEKDFYEYDEKTGKRVRKKYKKGRWKGHYMYERKVLFNVFPPYKQIDKLIHIGEEEDLFKPYQ